MNLRKDHYRFRTVPLTGVAGRTSVASGCRGPGLGGRTSVPPEAPPPSRVASVARAARRVLRHAPSSSSGRLRSGRLPAFWHGRRAAGLPAKHSLSGSLSRPHGVSPSPPGHRAPRPVSLSSECDGAGGPDVGAPLGRRRGPLPVRCTGQGPHPGTSTSARRGGLASGRPPRALGYPTRLPPPGGAGGFNVSRRRERPGVPVVSNNIPAVSEPWRNPCRPKEPATKTLTTLSGGSLGSCVDEERS